MVEYRVTRSSTATRDDQPPVAGDRSECCAPEGGEQLIRLTGHPPLELGGSTPLGEEERGLESRGSDQDAFRWNDQPQPAGIAIDPETP